MRATRAHSATMSERTLPLTKKTVARTSTMMVISISADVFCYDFGPSKLQKGGRNCGRAGHKACRMPKPSLRVRRRQKKNHPTLFAVKSGDVVLHVFQCLAERQGFEPREAHTSTVFKTAAIDHSAISPICVLKHSVEMRCKYRLFFDMCNMAVPKKVRPARRHNCARRPILGLGCSALSPKIRTFVLYKNSTEK